MSANNRKLFLAWLRTNHPAIYSEAMSGALQRGAARKRAHISGIFDASEGGTSIGDVFAGVIDNASNLANQYLQIQQQRDLMEINLQRARQGLAPIGSALPASGQLDRLESDIAGNVPWGWIGLGVGALALLWAGMRKR